MNQYLNGVKGKNKQIERLENPAFLVTFIFYSLNVPEK
jgi:hypothetical protein